MVSKAKSIKGSSQAIDYILNDNGQALELDRNGLVGTNGKEILSELRMVQESNRSCHNNTISIVLSPDAKQGNLSQEELKTFLHKHLDNLKIRDHQWIASVHNSTDNQHIHIIANRIDTQGKALNDSFISKRAQESAERIAKEHGFKTAKEISLDTKIRTKELKKEINQAIIGCKAKSQTFSEFCNHMRDCGFEVKASYNKSGAMFGMRIEGHSQSFKLSEINRNIKHYHFADILPKETLIKAPDFKQALSPKKSGNLIQNAISSQLKSNLGKELQGVFKAVDIASNLRLKKLVINVAKNIIVKGFDRGMSL